MRHSYELRDIIDEPWLTKRLGAFLEKRSAPVYRNDIVSDADAPAEYERFLPGHEYGRFHETIVRRELRRQGTPEWFDPREHEGQFGIINGSLRCYIQVRLDIPARNAPSTFDQSIMELVERTPEQASLFG